MNEQSLRAFVNEMCPKVLAPCHNFLHMRRVEAFGILLAKEMKEVDNDIVHWFAYLHDIKREKDDGDLNHGEKAAEYIELIRNRYLSELTNDQIDKLKKACALHTNTLKTGDPTIDVCFDADRLDLPRVNIKTDPNKMATKIGKDLAKEDYYSLCRFVNPQMRDRLIFMDDYIIRNYKIGKLAVRSVFVNNGIPSSPFYTENEWNCYAKSVCVEGWYKRSGIYAIRMEDIYSDNTFSLLLSNERATLSLLEYEEDDIACYNVVMPSAESLNELAKIGLQYDNPVTKEICLRRCNIVFSATSESFFNDIGNKIRLYILDKYKAFENNSKALENIKRDEEINKSMLDYYTTKLNEFTH